MMRRTFKKIGDASVDSLHINFKIKLIICINKWNVFSVKFLNKIK